jgi:hypothetical protein
MIREISQEEKHKGEGKTGGEAEIALKQNESDREG